MEVFCFGCILVSNIIPKSGIYNNIEIKYGSIGNYLEWIHYYIIYEKQTHLSTMYADFYLIIHPQLINPEIFYLETLLQ